MILTLIGDCRVGVRLDETDLGRLGIRFADMTLSSPAFTAALWLIKEEARQKGVDVDLTGRLLVEAFERGDGVELLLTSLAPEKRGRVLTRQGASPLVFKSADKTAVSRAKALLPAGAKTLRLGGYYYLISDCPGPGAAGAAEFTTPVPDPAGVLIAALEEYGEPAD